MNNYALKLYEARKAANPHPTIDEKIWRSVYGNIYQNPDDCSGIKPYGADKNDVNAQTQRYVAGLLQLKKPCPKTEAEIDEINDFKLIAKNAIKLGASIADFQKLYVENGGEIDPADMVTNTPEKPEVEPTDFPDYDEVQVEEPEVEPTDFPDYDEVQVEEPEVEATEDFPDFDDVQVEEPEIKEPEPINPAGKLQADPKNMEAVLLEVVTNMFNEKYSIRAFNIDLSDKAIYIAIKQALSAENVNLEDIDYIKNFNTFKNIIKNNNTIREKLANLFNNKKFSGNFVNGPEWFKVIYTQKETYVNNTKVVSDFNNVYYNLIVNQDENKFTIRLDEIWNELKNKNYWRSFKDF